MSWCTHYFVRGRALGIHQVGQPTLLHCDTVCVGEVREGTMPLVWLSVSLQSLTLLPTNKLGPSGADSWVGGRACAHSGTPWVSPTNSPVRLGVSSTVAISTVFYSQRFWGLISLCWNPGLCSQSGSPVAPPGLSAHKCGTTWPASCLTHRVL